MSIESEILGRGPVLYWPLDDPTGPAAVDATGNGHTGAYGGAFSLHQYGVEPGTFAAQFSPTGFVRCTGMPQIGTAPFTLVWYASFGAMTSSTYPFIQNGNDTLSRGWYFRIGGTTSQYGLGWFNTSGTFSGTTMTNMPIWNRWWHAWGMIYNGSGTWTPWLDGFAQANGTVSGTLSTTLSTDYFQVVCNQPAVVAHVAYYDKVLTSTDMQTIQSFRYDWPFGPMVNAVWPNPVAGSGSVTLSPTDPIVIAQNQDLTDIRQAVRRTYP